MSVTLELVERGLVPDWITRRGIRRLNRQRLAEQRSYYGDRRQERLDDFVRNISRSSIALHTEAANDQHYELPAEFFGKVLGKRLKYSSCYWPVGVSTLDEAETRMLELTCERAGISDGMRVLELGCGWGSLTLWMAEKYPSSQIVAVSNSLPQRHFIESRCRERRLENVTVVTRDMNEFSTDESFDRVVSVEMFEHMRNYEDLLSRVATWLAPQGRLFVHIFCHREYAYLFETEGDDNWMGRHFFTGGLMPSLDLLRQFDRDLVVEKQWEVNGRHYQRTSEAWLENMTSHRETILPILEKHYGPENAMRWLSRWRVFFMACAELFGHEDGREWFVSHYLLKAR